MIRLALAALLLIVSAPAGASMMLPMTVEDLSRRSDLVAKGRVIETESRRSEDGGRIYTVVTFELDEAWKGKGSERVEIHVPGGSLDGITQLVTGAPRFVEGEDAVVFLRELAPAPEAKGPPEVGVVGMAQGKLEIQPDASGKMLAVQRLEGLELVDRKTHEPVPPPLREPIPLEALKARVQAAER